MSKLLMYAARIIGATLFILGSTMHNPMLYGLAYLALLISWWLLYSERGAIHEQSPRYAEEAPA